LQLAALKVILFPSSKVKGATIKTTRFLALTFIVILLILTFYQVSRRINWDFSTKQYSIALRYSDISTASRLYGEPEGDLIDRLYGAGARVILFSTDLATERQFVKPEVLPFLKKEGITRGVEVSNLQVAKDASYRKVLDYLKYIEPEFLILRGLREIDIPPSIKNWLSRNDVILGTVEFRNDDTVGKLVKEEDSDWVRLHRVFDKEVGTLSRVEKQARYERAVQERNIGVIEYRIPLNTDLNTQIETLATIRQELRKSGFRVGPIESARGTGEGLESPTWLILIMIAASFGLLLAQFLPEEINYRTVILPIFVFAVACYLGLTLQPILTRQVAALGLAVIAPVAGYKLSREYGLSFNSGKSFLGPFFDLVWISVFSTSVGLIISSLLLDESFVLKLQQFRGVKVSLFFPLLLIVFASLYRDRVSFSDIKFDYKTGFFAALLVGLFLFLLLRSGNFTFLQSGNLEEAIRRWLEDTLYVRPRFKEFALGHPALIAWFYLAGRYRGKFNFFKIALLLVGFMGQISIINTFAHIHTPLTISLIRTGNGLVVGLILGAILLSVIFGGEYIWNLRKQ